MTYAAYVLYTALLAAGVTAYAPVAVARRLTRGVPLNLRARFGFGGENGAGPRGWVHAVSVGETIAAAPLVDGLHRAYPSLPLVVTTVTPTGARVVAERFAGIASHRYFPLDFPKAVERTLTAIDPAFFICMETELWPNTLRALAARGVPTMIANGRLSDRSFRRYRLVRSALRSMLAGITVFGMRSDEAARRLNARGFRTVRRSALPGGRTPGAVIVVDTVGELAQMYAVAEVVFVGGSLVPRGGHNVLEAALRRKPVLMGPHTDNFRDAAGMLTASGGAVVVRDAASLSAELRRLLADPALAARRGEACFEALAGHHGAVRQTLELVARFLVPQSLAPSGDGAR